MARLALIMGGGTGGHIFPGLAIADVLKARGWQVAWLGTRDGLEAKLVPQRGYPVEWISVSGVRGKGLLRWLFMPLMLLRAFAQSLSILRRIRPDVVLSMGGYVAFPGGMMASLLNRPLAVHSADAIVGLTNRVLAGIADRVLVGFPSAFETRLKSPLAPLLPKPRTVEWTGNPVRESITHLPAPRVRMHGRTGKLRVLIVGGSLGAKALNELVPQALAMLPEADRPHVVHQTGAAHVEAVKAIYTQLKVQAELLPFIADIAERYAWCDLTICRAGAVTVAEIAAAGVAALFVPFPAAVDDHQTANARFLADRGAAFLTQQHELSPEGLAQFLRALKRETLLEMAEKARALAKPDATLVVAGVCEELARGPRGEQGHAT